MAKYFGTDGIRGVANQNLTNEMVYRVGRYVGYHSLSRGKSKVLIGKDTRLSSSMFEASLAAGLMASGCDAYLLGYCSTPALAYLVSREDFAYGVMISASHNPFYDNGIKIFGNDGLKISQELEGKIENYLENQIDIPVALRENLGGVVNYSEGIEHYISWLEEKYPKKLSSLRLVCDLANGGACATAKKVFANLGAKVDFIHHHPDGRNINQGCGSTHLNSLIDTVKEGDYDLGFAFDGDADRVLAVDNQGEIVDGDALLYILSCYYAKKDLLPHRKMVMTVMSNIGLKKALQRQGIAYDITAVGDKNVVDKMISEHSAIGGEQSGHIINAMDAYFGDGVKTALNILNILLEEGKTLRELLTDLRIYPQLLKNVRVKDKNVVLHDAEIQQLIDKIGDYLGDNGRILVRPSGTEPLIRVMVEAESEMICQELVQEVVLKIIEKGYAE